MNMPIARIYEAMGIRQTYEATKYVMTRTNEAGEIEYASHRGWTTDMAQAHMRDREEDAPISFPKEMRTEGSVRSMTFKIFEGEGATAMPGDKIIVARACSPMGIPVVETPSFVVNSGVIGFSSEVGRRPWQAVTLTREAGEDTYDAAMERVLSRVTPPTRKVGAAHRPCSQRYDIAIMHCSGPM